MAWKTALIALSCLAGAYVLLLLLIALVSRRPNNLGVTEGRLAPCPNSPTYVSSYAEDAEHHVDPWSYTESREEAMAKLKAVLATLPRCQIVTANETYLHAEVTSLVFRFTDDMEFLIDDDHKVIHYRSASRLGASDLGTNRRRMEALGLAFREQSVP